MNECKDLKYLLCEYHAEYSHSMFKKHHPYHVFNTQSIISTQKCSYIGCYSSSHYEAIGIQIPSLIPDSLQPTKTVINEIFNNARQILGEGPALERLAVFLKSKLLPINTDLSAQLIIKHHAVSILQKLKINPNQPLTTKEINSILRELNLYPADYKNVT